MYDIIRFTCVRATVPQRSLEEESSGFGPLIINRVDATHIIAYILIYSNASVCSLLVSFVDLLFLCRVCAFSSVRVCGIRRSSSGARGRVRGRGRGRWRKQRCCKAAGASFLLDHTVIQLH
jgi:hypothetical protein